ncbi:hypothetical protein IMSAGC009_02880 [Lachnospiraceae bacterium]|nr:hypothetical protein IMSAGC009_02880 [Lachnospiraceae bacterium]
MCNNIVIFGPTHSGKSTLIGYLHVYQMCEDEYNWRNLRIKRKIEEMGYKYKKDRILAYYADQGIDEIKSYDKAEKSRGTSKRIHIKETALDMELNCTFIDTPGSDIAWKHKNEGLFLGEIGIFMIEIGKVIELSRKVIGSNAYNAKVNELFSSIYLWKHYKRMKRIIVVISKVDMILYSSYAVKRAESTLRSIDILKDVPIIPISIDVDNRRSHNVFECQSEEMQWYTGNSLITEIKKMLIRENEVIADNNELFAHIERIIPRTQSNNQPAVRVKVLNGTIHERDEIYLGPFKYNGENIMLKGQILSIKNETRGLVSNLSKGEIGGIIFSKLWNKRERLKLTDVKQKRTSIVCKNSAICREGNLLYFNIDKRYFDDNVQDHFKHIVVGNRLKLIWFGRIISMHLLYIDENSIQYNIVLMNTSSESLFMLPMKKNGKLLYEEFLLQLSDQLFINAHLSDLEMISDQSRREVIFTFDGIIEDISTLKGIEPDFICSYDWEMDQTYAKWNNLTDVSIKRIMESTMKFIRSRNIKVYKTNILPQEKNI